MKMRRLTTRVGLLAATTVVGALVAPSANAVLPSATVISGVSPFAACSNQGLATNYVNAEVEPSLAVNPLNSNNVATAWQQDRWGDPSEGGAHGLAAWSTGNGGVSGASSYAPFTTCSGGTAANHGNFDRVSDVWLSFGPDGTLYQSALLFNAFNNDQGITVSRSVDGGHTWGTPVVADRFQRSSSTHGDDKEAITADPYKPGYVYLVWDRYGNQNPDYTAGHAQNANKGPAYFSRSTDGGATWSSPKPIYSRDNGTIGNQIVVLPNGTLADFFVNYTVANVKGGVVWNANLLEIRSNDQGKTWSKSPIVVSPMNFQGTYDPNTGNYIRSGAGLFSVAVDSTSGALYTTWEDSSFNGVDQVAFAKSVDGGLRWSAPTLVSQTPTNLNPLDEQAFTPTVAVAANGAVVVTYYDFRNNSNGSYTATDYWAVSSTNGGATWPKEVRLTTSSFNAQTAPLASGVMIGDYEGLASAGNKFYAAFEITNNDTSNPTDIALATFTP